MLIDKLFHFRMVSALGLTLFFVLTFVSCSVNDKPQKIELGKDDCTACGMTITDQKFACEFINDKGKCFKFDDASCLFHYLNKNKINDSTVLKIYLTDYQHPDQFVDVKEAGLVLGESIKSPMGGGIAAFKDKKAATKFALASKSILLDSWERLKIKSGLE